MTYLTIELHSIPQTKTHSVMEYFVDIITDGASHCLYVFRSYEEAEKYANEYCKENNIEFKTTA